MVMAAGHTENSKRINKAKEDEQNYYNYVPSYDNYEGQKYAELLTEKIMQHSLPYKYYSKGEQEDGESKTTGDQGQNGTDTDELHS